MKASLYGRARRDPQKIQAYREHTFRLKPALVLKRICTRCRKTCSEGRWLDYRFVCSTCVEKT